MSKHILKKHIFGFTAVSNNTIRMLKDNLPCLGLYLYLLSLPDDWQFYKTQLCKDCKIGIKKLEKFINYLGTFGLVQYGQLRNAQGRFEQFQMHIYDLETLKINNLNVSRTIAQPVGQNCRTAETVRRSREAIQEIINKEENNIKKEILCASDDARTLYFDQFWNIYPKKKDKKRAYEIWMKEKYTNEILDLIFNDLRKRVLTDAQWQDAQFIPYAKNYLKNQLWTDIQDNNKNKIVNRFQNENKCAVKEWGPGHPTWESLNDVKKVQTNAQH